MQHQQNQQQSKESSEITLASKLMYMLAGWIFLFALLLCFVDETI